MKRTIAVLVIALAMSAHAKAKSPGWAREMFSGCVSANNEIEYAPTVDGCLALRKKIEAMNAEYDNKLDVTEVCVSVMKASWIMTHKGKDPDDYALENIKQGCDLWMNASLGE